MAIMAPTEWGGKVSNYGKKIGGGISQGWKKTTDKLASMDPMTQNVPKIDPNEIIKPIVIENPYIEELKKRLGETTTPDFAKAGQVGETQMGFGRSLEDFFKTGSAGLSGLISTLQRQQAGDFGPGGSLAQKILEQGLGQNVAGVRSQLASQRGLSPALAARYAAQQTAQLGGQTAQQAGILGLQQQLEAQKLLGQLTGTAATIGSKAGDVYGTARGQEIEQAKAKSDADLRRLNILASSDTGIRQLQAQTGISENEIRAKIAAANQAAAQGDRDRRDKILGSLFESISQGTLSYMDPPEGSSAGAAGLKGLLGGAGGAGGAGAGGGAALARKNKSDGGRIDGQALVKGDSPKNDIVPANLSPGEIVIPRSAANSKKAAKSFIDSLDDWDEEPSYSKVLQARSQKKNYADGGVVEPDMDKEILDMSRKKYLEKGFDVPIPGVAPMKQSLDDMLTRGVVEPMAKAGYPTLGAAMATVPSTLAEALIPSTAADLAGTLLPFPKGKLSKKAKDILKEQGTEIPKVQKAVKEKFDLDKLLNEFQSSDEHADLLKFADKEAQSEGLFGYTHRDYINGLKDYLNMREFDLKPNEFKKLQKELKSLENWHIKNKSIDEML